MQFSGVYHRESCNQVTLECNFQGSSRENPAIIKYLAKVPTPLFGDRVRVPTLLGVRPHIMHHCFDLRGDDFISMPPLKVFDAC
jgi:hypothetical protein